jgi:hypothetical protein
MLSTTGMSAASGKEKPVVGPGNQLLKINSLSFVPTPYDTNAYNILLHVETEPKGDDFQGFLKDTNQPDGPRYAGQVGKVRFHPYPYKDNILPNGNEISRDTEVMKGMVFLAEALDKRKELDNIQANTIEEFMTACNGLFSNSNYVNMCLGSKEWINKDGYINDDLFLPKISKGNVPIETIDAEPSKLIIFNTDDKNHYKKAIKKESDEVSQFEPAKASGNDFDL